MATGVTTIGQANTTQRSPWNVATAGCPANIERLSRRSGSSHISMNWALVDEIVALDVELLQRLADEWHDPKTIQSPRAATTVFDSRRQRAGMLICLH